MPASLRMWKDEMRGLVVFLLWVSSFGPYPGIISGGTQGTMYCVEDHRMYFDQK